jgi:hypothetical protein
MTMKIWFTDFWGGWDPLTDKFAVSIMNALGYTLSENNPDIIVYSVFGTDHKRYSCKKIFWTGENVRPNFAECDLAMTFDYNDDPRHLRVPLYSLQYWENKSKVDHPIEPSKFCAFIYGNIHTGVNNWGNVQDGVQKRIELFEKLSKYKKVDSCGSGINNTGIIVRGGIEKINYIRDYKFVFAIENSSYPGYVTEKIMDPFLAKSVPIYWGSDRIHEDFNENSFVNCHKFDNVEQTVEFIVNLDENQMLYEKTRNAEYIPSNSPYFDFQRVAEFVKNIQ